MNVDNAVLTPRTPQRDQTDSAASPFRAPSTTPGRPSAKTKGPSDKKSKSVNDGMIPPHACAVSNHEMGLLFRSVALPNAPRFDIDRTVAWQAGDFDVWGKGFGIKRITSERFPGFAIVANPRLPYFHLERNGVALPVDGGSRDYLTAVAMLQQLAAVPTDQWRAFGYVR